MSGIDLSVTAHRKLPTPRAASTSSVTGTGCRCGAWCRLVDRFLRPGISPW
jgi:hypothetical protein